MLSSGEGLWAIPTSPRVGNGGRGHELHASVGTQGGQGGLKATMHIVSPAYTRRLTIGLGDLESEGYSRVCGDLLRRA